MCAVVSGFCCPCSLPEHVPWSRITALQPPLPLLSALYVTLCCLHHLVSVAQTSAEICRCNRENRHRGLCNSRATIPAAEAFTQASEAAVEEQPSHSVTGGPINSPCINKKACSITLQPISYCSDETFLATVVTPQCSTCFSTQY